MLREDMHRYAQTNIQLLNQLHRAGYSLDELRLVRTAYELAIRLFTGRFRASGKTFIAHLVGTASVLVTLRASAPLVAAGLLHAAYQSGDFGERQPGITDGKRAQLRAAVGDGIAADVARDVEAYIARYEAFPWGGKFISDYHGDMAALSRFDREVLLMRLANELEEYLDLGVLYFGDDRQRWVNYLNDNGRMMIALGENLGFPALGASLAQAFKEVAEADFNPALRGPGRNNSFLLAPQSYQRVLDGLAMRLKGSATAKTVVAEPADAAKHSSRNKIEVSE